MTRPPGPPCPRTGVVLLTRPTRRACAGTGSPIRSASAVSRGGPSSSTTPARRLCTKTSPRATRRLRISSAPSCLRLRARLRLLRLTAMKVLLSSPQNGGDQARESSPRPGRSTLTTSAPMSPRICVQNGPAPFWVRSTTTVPSSGSATATSLPSPAGRLLRGSARGQRGGEPRYDVLTFWRYVRTSSFGTSSPRSQVRAYPGPPM